MFLATACIAHLNAVSPNVSLGALDQLARVIIISLLTVTLVTTRREFVLVLLTVCASLGYHSSKFGVGYLMRGGARFSGGIGGMFNDNNDFALAVARVMFLTIPCAQNVEAFVPFGKWVRRGLWVTLPLSMVCRHQHLLAGRRAGDGARGSSRSSCCRSGASPCSRSSVHWRVSVISWCRFPTIT